MVKGSISTIVSPNSTATTISHFRFKFSGKRHVVSKNRRLVLSKNSCPPQPIVENKGFNWSFPVLGFSNVSVDERPKLCLMRDVVPENSCPPEPLVEKACFNWLLPMLGKEYFFPNVFDDESPQLSLLREVSYDDEEEPQQDFVSKIIYYPRYDEVAQYPDDINSKISGTDVITEVFDVVSFLSTDKRSYLFLNDGHDSPIGVGSLGDKKWVMICCFFCPSFSSSPGSLVCRAVSNICYNSFTEFGDSFGMVLVLKMKNDFQADESAFRHMLSGFPSSCLVVPFWDSHSRDSICCSLGFSTYAQGLFVRVDERRVIWHEPLNNFQSYGVDMFPFVKEDVAKIHQQERSESWNSQSLENLFCCPSSVVLTKNPGNADSFERTTVEQLKEKLVGVYLCLNGELIPRVHELAERCKAIDMAFEVVLVYCPFQLTTSDPKWFQKSINRALVKRNISWWVLPFRSWVSLRLERLCYAISDQLIIVGKGFVDPDGEYFLSKIGRTPSRRVDGLKLKKEAIEEFKLRYQVSVSV